MNSQITNGISVSVEVFYIAQQSNPMLNDFTFAYTVKIENLSRVPVKLLRRHWIIFDSCGDNREVEGEGVVGFQPIIEPNELYKYTSGCNLTSDIGKMKGTYTMLDLFTKEQFEIEIPSFDLLFPYKMN